MNKRITFRGMDHSEAMENYVNEQLHKIEAFLENERDPRSLDIVLASGKIHAHHLVEFRLKTPHYDLVASHEGPHMYQEIDHVIDTMYHEILKAKERRIDDEKKKNKFNGA